MCAFVAGPLFVGALRAQADEPDSSDYRATAVRISADKRPLTARRFNEVSFVTTHNAMSNRDERWVLPNQTHSITRQLQDGVRGLMLDVHPYEGKAYLAHGKPALGRKLLVEGLREITGFLSEHPGEIVSIIFESYVPAADVRAAMVAADLERYTHTQPRDEAWPTLADMIRANRRLVVFTDREGGAFPWYHNVWEYCWDTDWANKRPDDFSSRLKRGKKSNALFILNHFLTNPFPSPRLADEVNHNPLLRERVQKVMAETGRRPNFVTVDFYEIGDVFQVVAELNGQ